MAGKHTPGPWSLLKSSGDGKRQYVTSSCGDYFLDLRCEVDSDDRDYDTAIANARLIAAAPDLLAACETIEQLGKSRYCDLGIDKMVRAAIAKAKE